MKPAFGTYLVCIEDDTYDIYRGETRVGTASLYLYPDYVTIDNIDIDEAYQGQGIGRNVVLLLKHHPAISMITGDSVPAALPFWAKMGAELNSKHMAQLDEHDDVSLVSFQIPVRNVRI